ncbi:MAG: transporter substrate-binding domain-containing protein [Flavobacteriales bacterium]|nr:transporter substrate-binding domain-containing protein [Flavobacteriales bacterium]
MRRKVLLAFGIVLFSAGCFLALRNFDSSLPEEGVAWAEPKVLRDLSDIQIDTLRILVLEDPLTWEVRPGAVSGLEHDLIRRFAKTADLNISFIPMNDPDSMLLALQLGKGDLMAAQLVMRNDYSKWVKFSRPYREVRPVLAVLREDPIPARAMDGPSVRTALDTIEISHWSPFAIPGYDLAKGVLADHYIRIERNITPEDLLMEVVMGRHHAAIISDARAAYEAGRFPVLDFEPLDCPDQNYVLLCGRMHLNCAKP